MSKCDLQGRYWHDLDFVLRHESDMGGKPDTMTTNDQAAPGSVWL
jgi:hypothetical protein